MKKRSTGSIYTSAMAENLSRIQFTGRSVLQKMLLLLRLFPGVLLLISILYILMGMKLLNTMQRRAP